jgi:hypothetical protein
MGKKDKVWEDNKVLEINGGDSCKNVDTLSTNGPVYLK